MMRALSPTSVTVHEVQAEEKFQAPPNVAKPRKPADVIDDAMQPNVSPSASHSTGRATEPSAAGFAQHVTAPNFVTTASLALGVAALLVSMRTGLNVPAERPRIVLALVAVAAALDAVDGPLARRLGTTGPFGGTLDSLADLVTFGVVPPVTIYFAAVHRVVIAGPMLCVAFCVCAAWRLARFQVSGHSEWFVGCPVPLAGALLSLLAALHASGPESGGAVAVLSVLMVGTVRFPTWSLLGSVHRQYGQLEASHGHSRAGATGVISQD
jgi:CDP-diacylglycerol---serine O-phosphatidyltransferase